MGGMLAGAPAQAFDWVPPFKGNDTGGIIAYTLAQQADARLLAVDHCARYGKVVKFLGDRPAAGRLHLVCLPLGALWRRRAATVRALLSRWLFIVGSSTRYHQLGART